MPRFTSLLALVAFCALAAVSCAREPGNGRTITRPAPDRNGLSDWLEMQVGEESEQPAFFIQMADPQLGMSGSPRPGMMMCFRSTRSYSNERSLMRTN